MACRVCNAALCVGSLLFAGACNRTTPGADESMGADDEAPIADARDDAGETDDTEPPDLGVPAPQPCDAAIDGLITCDQTTTCNECRIERGEGCMVGCAVHCELPRPCPVVQCSFISPLLDEDLVKDGCLADELDADAAKALDCVFEQLAADGPFAYELEVRARANATLVANRRVHRLDGDASLEHTISGLNPDIISDCPYRRDEQVVAFSMDDEVWQVCQAQATPLDQFNCMWSSSPRHPCVDIGSLSCPAP